MSKFLDYNNPKKSSGFYQLLTCINSRFLQDGQVLSTAPSIVTINSSDRVTIWEGTYTIINGLCNGLHAIIKSDENHVGDRTYIQFETGVDVSSGIRFNVSTSRPYGQDIVLYPNSTYVIKLEKSPFNNGYLIDCYKV